MAFVGKYRRLVPLRISELSAVAHFLKTFSLRPAKRVVIRFDPFNKNVKSIRDFLNYTSAEKYRQTNTNCVFKTEIVNDRSEPFIKIILAEDNREIIFKTANLTGPELLLLFNKHVSVLDTSKDEVDDPFAKKASSKVGKRLK